MVMLILQNEHEDEYILNFAHIIATTFKKYEKHLKLTTVNTFC